MEDSPEKKEEGKEGTHEWIKGVNQEEVGKIGKEEQQMAQLQK